MVDLARWMGRLSMLGMAASLVLFALATGDEPAGSWYWLVLLCAALLGGTGFYMQLSVQPEGQRIRPWQLGWMSRTVTAVSAVLPFAVIFLEYSDLLTGQGLLACLAAALFGIGVVSTAAYEEYLEFPESYT
ncbi:hypothetical protein [Longispora albida]|uniref:hypothetical protein n=1 Tax=Longispora albida TaxID=203523 RepID=UPI00035C5C3E|nr:hypothetical protein [Longispora albida]